MKKVAKVTHVRTIQTVIERLHTGLSLSLLDLSTANMLQRFKTQAAGPYNDAEKQEIEYVTGLILSNTMTWKQFKPVSELERDYVEYIRKSAFSACGLPFFAAGASFLFIDKLPGVRGFYPPVRWALKISSFLFYYVLGVEELKKSVYDFPLLDEVIAGGVVKFTKWVELPSHSHIDPVKK